MRSEKVRVGVMLDALELYAWEGRMLERVAESDYAELVVVATCGDARTPRQWIDAEGFERRSGAALGAPLAKIYRSLEAKIQCEHDAFEAHDSRALLEHMPIVVGQNTPRSTWATCTEADLQRIAGYRLDVWIRLGARDWAPETAAAAAHGVWSLHHTHCDSHGAEASAFWPVYYDWPVTESVVRRGDGADAPVLARTYTGTNRYSVKLNQSALYWKASALMPRALETLYRLGSAALVPQIPPPARHRPAQLGFPTNLQLARYIAGNVKRRAQDLLYRKFVLDRWILMVHAGEALCTSPERFTKVLPPEDRYWADPHVLRRDNRYYVFMEEVPFTTNKGHIAVLAVDEAGRPAGEATIVLERDYHLSYPCVFEHAGEVFMVPESSDNRTVDLYRCTDFPDKWEFVTTLLKDVAAVDTTVLYHEGRWWLFTGVAENRGASFSEELFLFHSDTLLGGRWNPHPANPVVSDARKARPAGAIFAQDGALYRPAQDCSVRYGYAMTLNRITKLSALDYGESETAAITPTWDRKIMATHTLAYTPGLTVIDALQPRLRI